MKQALRAGITHHDYWNMTLQEIIDVLEVFQEKAEDETKKELLFSYNTARLTSMFVLNGLNGKTSPSFNELFPDLFAAAPVKTTELTQAEYNRTMMYKEQMLDFAIAHNKKRKAKEGE